MSNQYPAIHGFDHSETVAALAISAEAILGNTTPNLQAQETATDNISHLSTVHSKPFPDVTRGIILLKRLFDIFFSAAVMILGAPVFIMLYFFTKFTSAGPALFKQERIGKNGQPFYIYKFRSMYIDAEKFGPQLSSASDPRITKWGTIIRRTRLDELPQFWNVLKGEMSVVGPRPERRYFIDKIMQRDPDYAKLQLLKPGLTSMGQVHFGYAENVDQMCSRMQYDLDYLQNINLITDLNVIAKTVQVMFQCKGK